MDYDLLLRNARDAYLAVAAKCSRDIETARDAIRQLEEEIATIETRRVNMEQAYHSAVVDLAERRLAGEFRVDASDTAPPQAAKKVRASRDTDDFAEVAVRLVPNPQAFTRNDAEAAYAEMFPERPPLKRSTLKGSLNRLAERGKLRIVEPGFKRKPTIYAVVDAAE
jgi:superfamily I DNA and/or RNA helicase